MRMCGLLARAAAHGMNAGAAMASALKGRDDDAPVLHPRCSPLRFILTLTVSESDFAPPWPRLEAWRTTKPTYCPGLPCRLRRTSMAVAGLYRISTLPPGCQLWLLGHTAAASAAWLLPMTAGLPACLSVRTRIAIPSREDDGAATS